MEGQDKMTPQDQALRDVLLALAALTKVTDPADLDTIAVLRESAIAFRDLAKKRLEGGKSPRRATLTVVRD